MSMNSTNKYGAAYLDLRVDEINRQREKSNSKIDMFFKEIQEWESAIKDIEANKTAHQQKHD